MKKDSDVAVSKAEEEKLRRRAGKILIKAATSGRLRKALSEGSPAKGLSDKSNASVPEPMCSDQNATCCKKLRGDSLQQDNQDVASDIDQVRQQAKKTLCDAAHSGKLHEVLEEARVLKSDSSTAPMDPESLRRQLRATLSVACRDGTLNDAISNQRAQLEQLPTNVVGRSQHRRAQLRTSPDTKQNSQKVEDTRDLEQLLAELGEDPKPAKMKKKSKTFAKPQESSRTAADDKKWCQSTCMAKERTQVEDSQPVSSKLAHEQAQLLLPQCDDSVSKSCDPLDAGSPSVLKSRTEISERPVLEQAASGDANLVAPAPALDRISRKKPLIAPVSLTLERPDLTKMSVRKVCSPPKLHSAKYHSKRWNLPPPPIELPPAPPEDDCQNAQTPVWEGKEQVALLQQCLGGALQRDCMINALRSIPVWPTTPESTPPSSPRISLDEVLNEVLVPVPLHLLAEVQQLLLAASARPP